MSDTELKDFEDYLSEFDSIPQFDSETCLNLRSKFIGQHINE